MERTANELFQLAKSKYDKAKAILADDAGEQSEADDLMAEALELEQRGKKLKQIDGFELPEDASDEQVEKKSVQKLRKSLEETLSPEIADAFLKMLDKEGVDVGDYQSPDEYQESGRSMEDFFKSVRYGDHDRLRKVYDAKPDKKSFKDLSGESGVSGAYTIPTQELSELLKVSPSEAVVRPRARKMPMASRSMTIPVLEQGDKPAAYWKLDYFGGVLSYWTEEGGAKTETEPEFGQMELVAHKLAGYTQATDELLADSSLAIGALLAEMFRGTINMREDFAFLRGTGVGMPLGILNSPVLLGSARDTANQIDYDDITNMLGSFLPSSFGSAVWVVSHLALPALLQMEDGAGNNVFIPNASGGVTQSIPGTMLGRPVIVSEKVPTLGNEGDVLLADFNYYVIGDRQQTTIASSEHYDFINDMTTWRFVHRVDGQPWLDAPIYIDADNQVSPFVALEA